MDLERIGPYRIVRSLGTGGMASAYLARHETLRKDVVLKVVSPAMSSVESYRKRFIHEAQALARLSHPNIVQVYDVSIDETCYMAMEYVEGRDLESWYSSKEPVDLAWLLGVARDVAAGLQCVHAAGLVHRDIKPGNILITPSGRAKITDFGIAIETQETMRLTADGSVIGTPTYMSPEQALGNKVDGRADLYSLGVVLYQGVAGRPPFQAESSSALLLKHAHEQPTPLGLAAPASPRIVQEIVKRLLSKKPATRYPSAAELQRDLEEAIEVATGRKREKPRAPARSRRFVQNAQESEKQVWTLVAGAAAAALVIAVIVALIASSGGSGPGTDSTERPPKVETTEKDPVPEKPSTAEARLRVENLLRVVNFAGLAAAYCDLKDQTDRSATLRRMMADAETRAQSAAAPLGSDGTALMAAERLRPGDRGLTSFGDENLDTAGKETAAALVGTFVAQVKPGSRVRVKVPRGERVADFEIRFEATPPELEDVIRAAGLVPGQAIAMPEPEFVIPKIEPPKNVRPPEPVAVRKPGPPDEAAQKKAEKDIREIYKEDYARTTAAARSALSKKLLADARNNRNDPAARFVLLREARDAAAQAGDAEAAVEAIDEMGADFEIDPLAMKNDALAIAAKNAQAPEDLKRLASACMRLAADAAAADEYDMAAKGAALAAASARRAKNVPVAARADALVREIGEQKNRYEKVRQARATLTASPEDPAANLVVGRYLCMTRGKWESGLPHLKKGSDEALKALAAKDLAAPEDAVDQVAVGDGWWDIAEKLTGDEKARVLARASHWYEKASPRLSGLTLTRIEKRLGQAVGADDWVDVSNPALFGLGGKPGEPIAIQGGDRGAGALLQIFPAGEFDGFSARIRLEKGAQPVGAIEFESGRLLYVDPRNLLGVCHREGQQVVADTGPHGCAAFDGSLVTLLLRDRRAVLYLEGRELGRFDVQSDRLTYLALRAAQGTVTFEQIRLHRRSSP